MSTLLENYYLTFDVVIKSKRFGHRTVTIGPFNESAQRWVVTIISGKKDPKTYRGVIEFPHLPRDKTLAELLKPHLKKAFPLSAGNDPAFVITWIHNVDADSPLKNMALTLECDIGDLMSVVYDELLLEQGVEYTPFKEEEDTYLLDAQQVSKCRIVPQEQPEFRRWEGVVRTFDDPTLDHLETPDGFFFIDVAYMASYLDDLRGQLGNDPHVLTVYFPYPNTETSRVLVTEEDWKTIPTFLRALHQEKAEEIGARLEEQAQVTEEVEGITHTKAIRVAGNDWEHAIEETLNDTVSTVSKHTKQLHQQYEHSREMDRHVEEMRFVLHHLGVLRLQWPPRYLPEESRMNENMPDLTKLMETLRLQNEAIAQLQEQMRHLMSKEGLFPNHSQTQWGKPPFGSGGMGPQPMHHPYRPQHIPPEAFTELMARQHNPFNQGFPGYPPGQGPMGYQPRTEKEVNYVPPAEHCQKLSDMALERAVRLCVVVNEGYSAIQAYDELAMADEGDDVRSFVPLVQFEHLSLDGLNRLIGDNASALLEDYITVYKLAMKQ